MRKSICILAFVLTVAPCTGAESQAPQAKQVVQRYLRMPHPEDSSFNEARIARLNILGELKAMPEDAVDVIGRALPEVKDPQQRRELTAALGDYFHTKHSAALLCGLLKDPDEQVRWQAIHGLRMIARRTDRTGGQRIHRGADFAAKVEGLVPYLISAASDKSEGNRVCALYALADTRDPSAVLEIRNLLKDPSERVRLYAACFLTEYEDAAGLPEMRAALDRLRKVTPKDNLHYYLNAEMLLASFERVTGKSFGRIPLNPDLCSVGNGEGERYNALLDTWAKWWAWAPEPALK